MSTRFFASKHRMLLLAAVPLLVPAVAALGDNPLVWQKPATITRVKKVNHEHSGPRQQMTSLLTLQWRLFQRGEGKTQREVDPKTVFRFKDHFRLALTTNQDGFLYIIHHEEGEDGSVIFPDPNVNGGSNAVKKNEEYVVPRACENIEDPKNCWIEMDEKPGIEDFIVIFSRDRITTLPNQVAKASGVVLRGEIEKLKADFRQSDVVQTSGRLAIPGQSKSFYATRLQNTNRKDNEEIIANIQLKHGERQQ